MTTVISTPPSAGGKGKERAVGMGYLNLSFFRCPLMILTLELSDSESEAESESSGASSTSESESDTPSDSEEEITEEYLQSLLQRARESAAATELAESQLSEGSPQEDNEEILILNDAEQPCVPLLLPIKSITDLSGIDHSQNLIREAYLRRISRLEKHGGEPVY